MHGGLTVVAPERETSEESLERRLEAALAAAIRNAEGRDEWWNRGYVTGLREALALLWEVEA